MRGYLKDGRTSFSNWQEQIGIDAGAFARHDFRPVPEVAALASGPVSPSGTSFAITNDVAPRPDHSSIILIGPDDAGDGIGLAPGNPVLTIDAAATLGTIGTIGDQDFYKVTLQAGHAYEIGMFGHSGGLNLFPLHDSYIEIYKADGTLVASADGGASTLINNVNSGFDAVLNFTPDADGIYYVNARAFDQDPNVGGSTGDGVGDYELYVNEVDPNDPNVYHAYYDDSSPLYAIDWGSRVNKHNQSAANPDGDEGIRPTGNAQGTPVFDNPALITQLAAEQHVNITGKNVITIYFAKAGDIFTSIEDPTSPGLPPATITATGVQGYEHDAVITALGEFAKVADIVYLEVQDRNQADFVYTSYQGTPGPGVSLLGSMSPPDEANEGLAQFNSGDERWNALNLQQGGFSYVTLIHEFGHGHGLAHPHDNGGHSGIMHGVESEGVVADYTTGDFDLNQGIFTMMSYEDGWQTSPYGNADTDVGYGYMGGLMAFDIAAIQDKYGVNEDTATGNDVYVIKDENAPGTYYTSIWDAGGIDRIVYAGARDATIDLRAATLQYEPGGGGRVSYAYGIYGGFTIANKVVIENATGGAGTDTLTGNAVGNILDGGAGSDVMAGLDGNDLYVTDTAADQVIEAAGQGYDVVYTQVSYALAAGSEIEGLVTFDWNSTAALALTGNALDNYLIGNAGDNLMNGGIGADVMDGRGGNDIYVVDNAGDVIYETAGQGYDVAYISASYVLGAGWEIEGLVAYDFASTAALSFTGNELGNYIIGNAGANRLNGVEGNDTLDGRLGDDLLDGGTGADVMLGGQGNDIYYVDNGGDTVTEAAGEGYDVAYVTASYTLTAGSEIEGLSTLAWNGTAAINLTGNGLANYLIGNDGANVLNGGAGSDFLNGRGGADTFLFADALGATNVDQIGDFNAADDTIRLDHNIFTGLGVGGLAPGAFVVGTQAGDTDDRIIYNQATGALFFDADGSGAGAAILFATLNGHPALTASDFQVI